MIIEYLIGYEYQQPVICCGSFRDLEHFSTFKRVEATYGRIVGKVLWMVLQ